MLRGYTMNEFTDFLINVYMFREFSAEAIHNIYKTSLFDFWDTNTLRIFVALIPTQSLRVINKLQVSLGGMLEQTLCDRTRPSYIPHPRVIARIVFSWFEVHKLCSGAYPRLTLGKSVKKPYFSFTILPRLKWATLEAGVTETIWEIEKIKSKAAEELEKLRQLASGDVARY